MIDHMKRGPYENFLRAAIASAFALASTVASAHWPGDMHGNMAMHEHTAAGEPGDPKKPARVVKIAMREEGARMIFVPDKVEARTGEQIRFVLTNEGLENHEFVLGTEREIENHAKEMKKHPGMEHDDAHSMTLGMYGSGDLVWRFTKPGRFLFACLIPGHLERGMVGAITVKDAK